MHSFSISQNQLRKAGYFARLSFLLAIFVLLPLQQTLAAPAQAPQTVSGTIFLDLDADGAFDTNEPGVGGIDIFAYDTDNNPGASCPALPTPCDTSAADGTYSIQTDDTQIARIEFTNIPSHLYPGPVGTDNQSSVVFLQVAGGGSTVNFGLMDPARHCSATPDIATPCFVNGNPHGGGDAGSYDALVSFPYTASGPGGGANTQLAINSEIGSTYGLAYQRTTDTLFASAVTKRHSGFGIISAIAAIPTTGGIYAIDTSTATVTPFIDLNGLGGVTTGTDPHCYTTLGGTGGTDCLDVDANNPTRDLNAVAGSDDAIDAVGKVSFGDMDISADDRTLWLVNTNESDRSLIEIFIDIDASNNPVAPGAADITEHAIPTNICTGGEERPWAVSVFQGLVYVGVVCDAASDLTAPYPDLEAYVISHDPAGAVGNFTQVDLNGAAGGNQIELDGTLPGPPPYPRGNASDEGAFGCVFKCITADWNPWVANWTDLYQDGNIDPESDPADGPDTPFHHVDLPQPMLTDIEFLDSGTMIIGLRDRAGDQTGNANFSPTSTDPINDLFEGVTAGDLLCLSANDPTNPTVWTLEDDAICGAETSDGSLSTGKDQGPGGSEFFWQDMYDPNVPGVSTNPDAGIHTELTQGGLTYLPGTTEIVTTAFDPVTDFRAGGVLWFETEDDVTTGGTNEAGTRIRGYEVFAQDAGGTPTTYGKSNGLGDLELLCPAAPVEIGNRIWIDADNDGIQDGTANGGAATWPEPGINGVTVQLYLDDGGTPGSFDATDTFVTSTVTAGAAPNQGQYYFTNLVVYTDYLVVIDMTQAAITGPGYNLTTPNAGAKDTIDSDATLETVAATDYAVIFVDNRKGDADPSNDTGGPGDNNHTYDAGFNVAVSYNLGNYVWYDDNFNGDWTDEAANRGVNGVTVRLWQDDGNGTFEGAGTDTLINTTVTADFGGNPLLPGYYLFTNVAAEDYFVEFDDTTLPAGYGFTLPNNLGGNDDDDSDADNDSTLTTHGVTPLIGFLATADDLTWDAGLVQLAELGDYVWADLDLDGEQNDGIPSGVNGVTVNLWLDEGAVGFQGAGTDTFVSTTVTADNGGAEPGYYLFTDLYPDDYLVEFILPAVGYTGFTTLDAVADNIDSDADDTTTAPDGVTISINLSPGESDLSWDAGLVGGFDLGDYVWFDDDLGGNQNEAVTRGVNGVTVYLWEEAGAAGFGGAGDDTLIDTEVTANHPISTDPGYYLFTNVPAEDYYIQFDAATLPAGYGFTTKDTVADDIDSDVEPNSLASNYGVTDLFNFPALADDLDWDAGLVPAFDLGDYVWFDNNFNGQQDEAVVNGVNGVDVILWLDGGDNAFDGGGGDDTQIATTTTANDGGGDPGYYLFPDLPAGHYWVQFDSATLPAGYGFTVQDQGADATDSDVNPDSTAPDFGVTTEIVFPAAADDLTWDAGLVALSSLGNYVWADLDSDGTQNDGAASGQNNVTVTLWLDDGDDIFQGAGTDTNLGSQLTADFSPGNPGYYLFTDLYPDDYFVEVVLPPGYSDFTTQNAPGAPPPEVDTDSDVEDSTGTNPGVTSLITLPHNTQDLFWDAGLIGQGVGLGDYVWYDTAFPTPADGLQNEPVANGVNGVTVTLWQDDGNGTFEGAGTDTNLGSMVTANHPVSGEPGYYFFPNLNADDYFVQFSNLPAGFTFTQQNVGGDDSIDSDADPTAGPTFGVTPLITFLAAADDLDWDAGLVPVISSLGNYVWIDDTNNDIQDEAPAFGFNGVTVELFADDGAGGAGGVFDGTNTLLDTQVTANHPVSGETGYYLFDNLAADNYFVRFIEPAGFNFVTDNVGADDAIDSDADPTAGPTFGVTPLITLPANTQDLRWDAGLIATAPASLGDFVWDDLNADGIQDPGEPGINGITTNLYTGCGGGTPACTTFVTSMLTTNNPVGGAPGWYTFDNLIPNQDYQVEWILPIGTIFSPQDTPPDDALDSDADQGPGPNIGRSQVVSVPPGTHDPTIDAGLDPNKVGDFVWADLNKDGIQDPGEPPVSGVPVRLIRDTNGNNIYDPAIDAFVASRTTDSNGRYLFTPNDPTATFFVVFDPPAGTPITLINTGGVAVDSDVDPLCNCTIALIVPAGVTDLTWDMGLILDLDEEGNLVLPETGFAPSVVTELPAQPKEKAYQDLGDLWLEIPSLDIEMPIVGVPFDFEEGWDVTWLDDAAGYLDGTAYPTHIGNTAITAHVTDSFGNDGPFAHLEELGFGDVFYIHAFGRKYSYQVVNNQVVSPTYTAVLDSDAFDRVTLLTCKGFNEDTDSYQYRVAVEAVLTSFGPDVPD